MPQPTQVRSLLAGGNARVPQTRSSLPHKLWIAALALIGLVSATTASADSLAMLSGGGQSGLIGQSGSKPLVIELRNVDGAVIPGRTISWATSNGFQLGTASSVTDANGQASVNFTFGNYGTTDIVATDTTSNASMLAPEYSVGSDSITLISGGGQSGLANTVATQPIVVEVRDAAGQRLSGRTVNWADQTAYTQVNTATSITNASGQASMGFTFLQTPPAVAGTAVPIRATNSVGGQFVAITETPVGFPYATLVSAHTISGVYGSTSGPIVVKVQNVDGTPVAGAVINWADRVDAGQHLDGTLVTPSSTSTTTDANGLTSITVNYVGCGSGDVEASFGTLQQVDVPYTAVCTGSLTLLSPKPLSGAPSSASTSPIVFQARNQDGTVWAGATMTWSTGTGDAVPNATSSVIDASGRATMGFTFGTVFSTICATLPNGLSACENLQTTPTESIQLVSGEAQVGTAGAPGAQPLVVEVLDGSGNPVAGRIINWSQAGLDPPSTSVALSTTSSTTDASGRTSVSFTYQQPGRTIITAIDSNTSAALPIRVTAVGMDTFAVITGTNQSGLVGTHSAQPLVAELRDGAGNPVVGVSVHWGTNSPLAGCALDSSSSVTDASGRVSMGFTYGSTAGICSWEADDPASRARAEFSAITVGADALNLIAGNGQSGSNGAHSVQPLVVEVRDAVGSAVAGRTITWTGQAAGSTPDAPTSVTGVNGRALMGFTFNAGNSTSSTSTITANDTTAGHTAVFNISTNKAQGHAVIVSGGGQAGQANTSGQPIVLQLFDESGAVDGNGDGNVTWSVLSGPATLTSSTTTTDANGHVTASFNFGATPGTSIIQASGTDPNAQFVQITVVTLANNQSLTIVSGNNQTLVGGTTSAPLVVQLKDVNNAPVVGASIDWTVANGHLGSASSVTDASGKASNTVSASGTGPVSVQADSTRAGASVTFNFSAGLAELPGLTPAQAATATAIDNACASLANKPNLSPQEADLLAQCEALNASSSVNSGSTVNALNQLLTKTTQVQSTAASVAAITQFQNINARLTALRSGSQTSSLSGLAFNGSGGMVPVGALLDGFLSASGNSKDASSKDAGAGFDKWGLFVTGMLGHGAARPGSVTPGYDFDTNGLTFGIDYRKQENWIFGAAVGYSRQDTDLAQKQGSVGMTGYSLSIYNTFTLKKIWYLDSVLTLGHNNFDLSRRIAYTLPLPNGTSEIVDQLATSQPGGNYREAALTFGGDFHKDAWNFSPYGQVIYSRLGFDAYQESLQGGAGSGLGLSVDARTVTGLTSILGTRISFSHSADWGVLVPTASLEWNHEFKSDAQAIEAQFIYDPTHTPIKIVGDATDSDYFRLGFGISGVFPQGRSAFLLYEKTLARSGLSQYNIAVGLRLEF